MTAAALRALLVRMRDAAPKTPGVWVAVELPADADTPLVFRWRVPCPCARGEVLSMQLAVQVALADGRGDDPFGPYLDQARHELARKWAAHRVGVR